MKGHSFIYKKVSQTFLANLRRVKMLAPKPTIGGNKNKKVSMLKMSTVQGE